MNTASRSGFLHRSAPSGGWDRHSPGRRWFRLSLAVAGFLLLVAPAPGQWNTPPADLHLQLDARGAAHVTFAIDAPLTDSKSLEQALAQSLGGPLQNVQVSRQPGDPSVLLATTGPLVRRTALGLGREGEIDLTPLIAYLRRQGVPLLGLSVVPPPLGPAALLRSSAHDGRTGPFSGPFASRHEEAAFYTTAEPPLAPKRISYGYKAADLVRLVPLVLLLATAVALTLRSRRQALRLGDTDPIVGWYDHWRFHQWLTPLTWAGWAAGLALTDVSRMALFLAPEWGRGPGLGVAAVVLLLPPAATLALCGALAAPVFERVPEAGWTRRRVTRRAVLGQVAFSLVLLLVCLALGFIADGARGPAAVSATVGLLCAIFLGGAWLNLKGSRLVPLPEGPVRARAFELAEDAIQRLQQIFVLPPAQWRLINVFAFPGLGLHLTPPLLEHLTTREVDALMAHELTHLGRQRTWSGLGAFLFGVGFGPSFVVFLFCLSGAFNADRWWPLFGLVLLSVIMAGPRATIARRFAPRFDQASLRATKDPEALITALAKLARLGLLPITGHERAATSGLPWRRLEAIADKNDIPDDRLMEIVEGPGSGRDYYPLLPADLVARLAPESEDGSGPVFTASAKQRLLTPLGWGLLTATAAGPCLATVLLRYWGWEKTELLPLVALAAPLTWAARRTVQFLVLGRWRARMRRLLTDRLEREGLGVAAAGTFVGLAPGPLPGIYESLVFWDLGFLLLTRDRVIYVGDQARFALRREQVTAVELVPGAFRGRSWLRVRVSWRSDDGFTESFTVNGMERSNWLPSGREVRHLCERLQRWQMEPPTATETPPGLAALLPPRLPAPGRENLVVYRNPGTAFATALVVAAMASAFGMVLGLSFDPDEGGEGLFAVLLAVVFILIPFVFTWRPPGKEPPGAPGP